MPTDATPIGKPDQRSKDDWLLLGLITIAAIEDARQRWAGYADSDLLGIRGVPLGEDGWQWDEQQQIYVGRSGHKLDSGGIKNVSLLLALAAGRCSCSSGTSKARNILAAVMGLRLAVSTATGQDGCRLAVCRSRDFARAANRVNARWSTA